MKRLTSILAVATAGLAMTAATASAHVTANPNEQTAGSFTKLEFRVPNEKATATTMVEIQIPESVSFVSVQPTPGWSFEAKRTKLDEPVTAEDGDTVTDRISEIVFTGGKIQAGEFQSFYISMKLPEEGDQGDHLFFPTLQSYGSDVVSWTQKPEGDADPFSLETPAPFVTLGAAADSSASHSMESDGAADTTDTTRYATDEHVHDHVQKLYAISGAALALALIALVLAVRKPQRD